MTEPIELAELLKLSTDVALARVHTSKPGKVVSFNPATQTANIQLLTKQVLFTEAGDPVSKDYGILPDVPVMWFRVGGFVIRAPISKGDLVTVLFTDESAQDAWTTGDIAAPTSLRRHGLGSAWFIPGGFAESKPLDPADVSATDVLVIGVDGGVQIRVSATDIKIGRSAVDFVALSSKVNANFAALISQINTVAAATLASPDGGKAALLALGTALSSAFPSVSALIAKAE